MKELIKISPEFQLAERILHTLLSAQDGDWNTIVGRAFDLAERFVEVGINRGHVKVLDQEQP